MGAYLPVADYGVIDNLRLSGDLVLLKDGLVRRYDADDGLPGTEGGFGVCTSWLIHTLALSGRREEARELFAPMAEEHGAKGERLARTRPT